MRLLYLSGFLMMFLCYSCGNTKQVQDSGMSVETNPPAAGFDLAGSDTQAIQIADEVMKAMGGRANYDATRFLSWNFFGFRAHVWDKHTGDVRIENLKNGTLYLMNINDMKGRAFVKGEEITEADSLATMMKKGKAAWINDAYWLVMPFKLKDSGVRLSYVGEEKTADGKAADVLEMVFKEVGVTPQNKYRVWVEKSPRLITQWAFYPTSEDEKPRFTTPWINYEKHGNILLSGDRGERKLTDISVKADMAATVFTQP